MSIPRRTLLLAWALLLGAAVSPLPAGAQRAPVAQKHPEVKKLVFDGLESVDQSELKRNIATSESGCVNLVVQIFFCWISKAPAFYEREYLDREELQRDLLRIRVFYYKRGYRHTQVDTSVTPDGDGVRVTFHIAEGPPTRITRMRVLYDSTVLTQKRVMRLVSPRAGEPLNLLSIDTARTLLEQELWENGYPDARVDTLIVVDTARKAADLTFRAVTNQRATVGTITIRGTEKVDPRTVVNAITLRTGEIFRRSNVLLSQRNLYESNLFRTAIVTVPPQTDTVKDIEISLLEAPVREARTAFGFSTIDYLQADARFTHFNVFGGARRLDITGAVGNLLAEQLNGRDPFREVPSESQVFLDPTFQASIDLRQPAFLQRPENAVGIGAFIHRRAAPDVYVDRGYGATATYTRNIGVRDKASLNYRFEITRVEATDVYFCVNYGVCDTTTINVLRSHQRLNPLLTSYLRDRSNETFTPTTGHVIRAEAEHASALTASAYRYNRVFGDAAYYFRVRPSRAKGWASSSVSPAITNTVLAVHLRVGLVRPLASGSIDSVLHPRKRFYAGGAQSVRGYGENQLGPRILTVDPRRLAGATSVDGGVCNWQTLDIRFCDPNSTHADTSGDTALQDKFFFARPLGGTSLVEGSVELRFPIWKKITGAAFVDAATVGEAAVTSFTQLADLDALKKGAWAVTPGIGVRYHTRVGPIRVDIGYNPARVEQLPVATQVTIDGQERIVPLVMPRHYDPTQSWYQRMTLHLSIGQAY